MRKESLARRYFAPLILAVLLPLGCAEQEDPTALSEGETLEEPPARRGIVATLTCEASVALTRVQCQPEPKYEHYLDRQLIILGGQGQFIQLVSSNVNYDGVSQVFSADVTVENLIFQTLGTPDEFNVTGVRVFFHSGPTVTSGTGTVTVANQDGTGTFTAASQPYHEYDEALTPPGFVGLDAVSSPKNWQWDVPTTVNQFVFEVFVEADVAFPNGTVQITPSRAILAGPASTVDLNGAIVDEVGRATAGTVTWSSANPAIATVNSATGLVTAQSPGIVDIFATPSGPEDPRAARVTIPRPGYQIDLRYLTVPSPTQQAAFDNAAARWEAIITTDLPEILAVTGAPFCGSTWNEYVDDVVINVILAPIDGPGNILGAAGPCGTRPSPSFLSALGIMTFDTDDLAGLEGDGRLEDVILHEMGHVLGIGTLWQAFGLLLDDPGGMAPDCDTPSLNDPYFDGAQAVAAFDANGGASHAGNKVPVEDQGGPGTRCGHWREFVFETELMTGFVSAPGTPNPLSVITIESLEDMGYAVDPNEADAYAVPNPVPSPPALRAAASAQLLDLSDDIWRGPVFTVDAVGRMQQVLPDRRPEWQRQVIERFLNR